MDVIEFSHYLHRCREFGGCWKEIRQFCWKTGSDFTITEIGNLIIYNMAQWILNQGTLKIINSAFDEIQNTYILIQTCPFKISFDAALVSLLIQLHRLQIW